MDFQPKEVLHATLKMYWSCMHQATISLIKGWPIFVGCVLIYLFWIQMASLFGGMGFGGGFLLGFIYIALLALFYHWISELVEGNGLAFQDLIRYDYSLFFNVINVAFILWIVDLVVSMFAQGSVSSIGLLVQLGIYIVFNAIPEVIYQRRYDGPTALSEAFTFTRDNWIEWFAPYIALAGIIVLFVSISPFTLGPWTLALMAQSEVLLPVFLIVQMCSVFGIDYPQIAPLLSLGGIVLGIWFMLFRGVLFQELSQGSRRQRLYQNRI